MRFARSPRRALASCSIFAVLVMSGACTQYPTERQGIVDLRPQVSFKFDATNTRLQAARIEIDGLDAGRLADFAEGQRALRVLAGTHVVRVVIGSEVLLNEKVYLADGVSRPFLVP